MKLSCIFINNNLSNLYINTGYYAHKVAKEMISQGYTGIEVKEFTTEITNEQLVALLLNQCKKDK